MIREHQRLLETLIHYWELESDGFIINGKYLKIETEDIYFLTGLSHQGDVVKLREK
jgi:hypothetical protein